MEYGYHLPPLAQGVRVFGRRFGLVQPQGLGLATVEHLGDALLPGVPGGGAQARTALDLQHRPRIFNTDQGTQLTRLAFTGRLAEAGIQISRDGRGRAHDHLFVERLWRSVKYEEVYPKAYDTFDQAYQGLEDYFKFYNDPRPHQALNNQTPAAVYADSRSLSPCGVEHPP